MHRQGGRCDGSEEGSSPFTEEGCAGTEESDVSQTVQGLLLGQSGGQEERQRRDAGQEAVDGHQGAGQKGDSHRHQERGGQEGGPTKKAAAPAKAPAPAKKATTSATVGAPAAKKAVIPKPPPKKPSVGPYAKEPKFLDEQRALLLEERSVYSGQAVDLRAEADSLALEREPGDVQFDEESGEGGTVTVDRERNLALSAQASAAVEEIDDALRKIERKSYGGCERCHQAIPKARLRALPFARLCVACKSGGLSRR